MKNIKVDVSYDISNILKKEQLIDCSITFNGEILVLTLLNKPDRYEENGCGIFPKVKSDKRNNYRIHLISKEGYKCIDVYKQKLNYHFIRDLGNETFLLACARSYFYEQDKYDLNAHIFDYEGNKITQFLIGDGIQDIKVSSKGVIWTSYFDEGVFGNYGWDNPIGADGLRAWDFSGDSVYSYQSPDDRYFISDCYALNISKEDEIWFYFYTDFYIGRFSTADNIKYWQSPISGSQTLLIKDNYLLLDGGYQKRKKNELLKIVGDRVKSVSSFKFMDEQDEVLETLYYFYGSKALFLKENKLYIVDIEKIV